MTKYAAQKDFPVHPTDVVAPRAAALRRDPGWVGIVGGYTAYGLAYSVYTSYLVTALEDDAGFAPSHAAAVYSLVGLSFIGGGTNGWQRFWADSNAGAGADHVNFALGAGGEELALSTSGSTWSTSNGPTFAATTATTRCCTPRRTC